MATPYFVGTSLSMSGVWGETLPFTCASTFHWNGSSDPGNPSGPGGPDVTEVGGVDFYFAGTYIGVSGAGGPGSAPWPGHGLKPGANVLEGHAVFAGYGSPPKIDFVFSPPADFGQVTGILAAGSCPLTCPIINLTATPAFSHTPSVPLGIAIVSTDFSAAVPGHPGAYSFAMSVGGSLPPGLSVAHIGTATQRLSGTPTFSGVYTFSLDFDVLDPFDGLTIGCTVHYAVTMTVVCPTITISPSSVSLAAMVGSAIAPVTYTAAEVPSISATYAWVVASGTLPPGVALSSGGVLSGTPTQAGVFYFAVKATLLIGGLDGGCSKTQTQPFGTPLVTVASIPEILLQPDSVIGLTWIELLDSDNNLRVWSKVALPDPAAYYGGYKEDRVTQWGPIIRGLSDRLGQYQGSEFACTVSDEDYVIRTLLENNTTHYFTNRPVTVRMISDADRRLLRIPRTVVKGVVRDYKPLQDLLFEFDVRDTLAQKFDPANTTDQMPQRVITVDDFPNCGANIVDSGGKTLPVGALGLPVPIIYGVITDTQLESIVTPASVLPDVDPTLPAPVILGQIGRAGDLRDAGNPSGRRNSYVAGYISATNKLSPLSNEGGNVARDSDFQNPSGAGVNFSGNAMYDSYYIFVSDKPEFNPYGSPGSAEHVVYITHDNVTHDGEVPGADFEAILPAWSGTGITDLLSGATAQPIDQGDGQCPCIYVGDQVVGADTYRKFLIAGHACKSIDEIYVDNNPQNIATDATQAGTGGIWLVPGYAGWLAAFGNSNLYEDINGNRYCVVYGKVGCAGPDKGAGAQAPNDDGSMPLAFSVQGIESRGDGTGVLITDIHAQYLHCLQNWVLQSYASGQWLPSPTFVDDAALPMIDEGSFAAASLIAHQRVSGGYRGDFIIGATAFNGTAKVGGKLVTLRDVVAQFNVSADVDFGFNRHMQIMVSMEAELVSAIGPTGIDAVQDIFDKSFSIEDKLEEQFNSYIYQHTQDYFGRDPSGWRFQDTDKNDESIDGYQEEKIAPVLQLAMIRGVNRPSDWSGYAQGSLTAIDVVGRRLRRTKSPPRYATWTMGWNGMNFELGDIIQVTHFDGIGPGGWTNRPVRIVSITSQPEDFSVVIRGYDMGALYNLSMILGDRTVLPPSWPPPLAQQIYAYLGDRVSGQFSNGDPIKRLT